MKRVVEKTIPGGQTGADRAALDSNVAAMAARQEEIVSVLDLPDVARHF
jgi:hypothetical protein